MLTSVIMMRDIYRWVFNFCSTNDYDENKQYSQHCSKARPVKVVHFATLFVVTEWELLAAREKYVITSQKQTEVSSDTILPYSNNKTSTQVRFNLAYSTKSLQFSQCDEEQQKEM